MINQSNTYNKSYSNSEKITSLYINNLSIIGPFYSIRLKEINKVLNVNYTNLHSARASCIIISHLNNYSRCLQTSMKVTYGLSWQLISKILKKLLELGLIKQMPMRKITNIQRHVDLTAYSITTEGKLIAKQLNELLEQKVSLLKKKPLLGF